jgi:hypothetical protein
VNNLLTLRYLPLSDLPAEEVRRGPSGNEVVGRVGRFRLPARVVATVVLSVLFVLALSACTFPGGSAQPTPTAGRTVPAPNGGSADEIVTPPPIEPSVDVSIAQPAVLPTGVSVKLASVTAMTVTAETPGENSGPAVVVAVVVTNDGKVDADVDSAYLTLVAADGEYGIPTTAGPNVPLKGQLRPGQSATGSYVFMLSAPAGREVTVTVTHSAGQPAALFTGTIS